MERAICGIHVPGTLPCRHCERARAVLDAELAIVEPRSGAVGKAASRRVSDDDVARIRELAAQGMGPAAIARAVGNAGQTVAVTAQKVRDIVRGKIYRKSVGQLARESNAAMSAHFEHPRARVERQSIVPNRRSA